MVDFRHTPNAPLRSGKGLAYECGTRVPTVISWPGLTEANRRCDGPIVCRDFFPTILSAAGIDLRNEDAPSIEGRGLTPLLGEGAHFDED